MAKIAVRAIMSEGQKIYGQLPDRFIMGREVVNLDFSPLNLLDIKRYFKFYDRKITPSKWRGVIPENIYVTYTTTLPILEKVAVSPETLASDTHTPPIFYSSSMSGNRNFAGVATNGHNAFIGNLKGGSPIYTIDNTGNAGDFLSPGTKLIVSQTGYVHTYATNGPVDLLYYPAASTAKDSWAAGWTKSLPMILGYSPWSATQANPYYEQNNPIANTTVTAGYPGGALALAFSKIIHQDATYIVYFQFTDFYVNSPVYEYSTGNTPAFEMTAVKKSDGYLYNITLSASHIDCANPSGLVWSSVTTTEATPQKACVFISSPTMHYNKYVRFNKIIGNTITNVGSPYYNCYFYGQTIPTRIMENKASSYATHWKCYYPMYNPIAYDNTVTFQLCRFNKTLTAANTLTACTISGLPAEYASTDGTKIKSVNTSTVYSSLRYDAVWAAEIYDGTDQYIVYWIGRSRNPWWTPNVDTYSYSETSDTQYRYFLVFKVDPTDDSKLIYQSCVPEIKYAKPIHCAVASPDNKYIALANADSVFCLVWDSASKSFICTDTLSLPGVVSMGMDENQGAAKATVFCEVLSDLTVGNDCPSYVYQIDFGDYEDCDLRYFNGTAYVTDFGYSSLTLVKDGEGNYTQQTATFQVRVKNRVAGVPTDFVVGKTIKLSISGVRTTDEVQFVGYDTGIPLQKTITTASDWVDVSFNFKYPIKTMKINAEIL